MRKTIRDGEYLHSTHGIWYSVRHHMHRHKIPVEPIPCFGFLHFEIGNLMTIPTIPTCCLASEQSDYYPLHERQFTTHLRAHYPHISRGCAAKITQSFMEILEMVNATHDCPQFSSGDRFAITNAVVVKVHEEAPEDFDDPRVKPATPASVLKLLKASPRTMTTAWNIDTDKECSICMEEMLPSNPRMMVLGMPCSHLFHRSCVLRWLDYNHSCPLCRYRLPCANYRSLLRNCYVN